MVLVHIMDKSDRVVACRKIGNLHRNCARMCRDDHIGQGDGTIVRPSLIGVEDQHSNISALAIRALDLDGERESRSGIVLLRDSYDRDSQQNCQTTTKDPHDSSSASQKLKRAALSVSICSSLSVRRSIGLSRQGHSTTNVRCPRSLVGYAEQRVFLCLGLVAG